MRQIQPGDAVIAKQVRIAQAPGPVVRTWFELTVVPEAAARRYRVLAAAVKQGQAIAEQCGVHLWYTEDQRIFIPIVAPRQQVSA